MSHFRPKSQALNIYTGSHQHHPQTSGRI